MARTWPTTRCLADMRGWYRVRPRCRGRPRQPQRHIGQWCRCDRTGDAHPWRRSSPRAFRTHRAACARHGRGCRRARSRRHPGGPGRRRSAASGRGGRAIGQNRVGQPCARHRPQRAEGTVPRVHRPAFPGAAAGVADGANGRRRGLSGGVRPLVRAPGRGLFGLFGVVVPLLPILFFLAPGLWRNICPLAAANQAPRVFGFSRGRTPPDWLRAAAT